MSPASAAEAAPRHARVANGTTTTIVLADGTVVGRIMKLRAAPVGSPWLWTTAIRHIKSIADGQCVDFTAMLGD
jgi:hypothetical protein